MLTLTMTNEDYYDADTDEYVMTVGASVRCLQTTVKIKDEDGYTWECYINNVKFIAGKRGRRDVYIVRYKVY